MSHHHEKPPEEILMRCVAIKFSKIPMEKVTYQPVQFRNNAAVYKITIPPDETISRDENYVSNLEKYCQHLENLVLSLKFERNFLNFPLLGSSLYLKIVTWFVETGDEHRLPRIYNLVMEAQISCIRYYDVLETCLIVISDAATCNLHTYLEKTALSNNEKLTLCKKYAELVSKLHKLNIAHCDLKPSNVLVFSSAKDISLKLTDFEGCSCLMDNSFTSRVSETDGYWDKRRQAVNDFGDLIKRDFYSLGINFIDIMMSKGNKSPLDCAVQDKDNDMAAAKITEFKASILGGEFRNVVVKLLEYRYGSMEELLIELESLNTCHFF